MAIFGSGDGRSAPERADELGEMVLDNHAGEQRRVGDYWEDGPAVLVFLRHYG
jgi:hypothetical protein